MAIVKLNNDIRELELEEQKEIEVILSNLSQMTAEQTDSIRADLDIMVQLDVIFARASLAMDMNATEPIFNDEGRIRLKQARHRSLIRRKQFPSISVSVMILTCLLLPHRTPVVRPYP